MKLNRIPPQILNPACDLLEAYVPGLTPAALVAAIQGYNLPCQPDTFCADKPPRKVSLDVWAKDRGVSYWTARRLALEGKLAASKIGSQWRVDIDAEV